MPALSGGEITVLLEAVRRGEPTATTRLVELVYPQLHHLARGLRTTDPASS